MIDFSSLVLDPLYLAIGVPATVTPGATSTPVDMTAMDQTNGVVVTEGKLGLQAIKPACSLRLTELAANGIAPSDLSAGGAGTVTLYPGAINEVTWRIESYSLKPTPSGPGGEVQLILIKVP
jgi:hypothetical protein